MTHEAHVCLALAEAGEALTAADLAERLGISASGVKNALALLAAEGRVEQVKRSRGVVWRPVQEDQAA